MSAPTRPAAISASRADRRAAGAAILFAGGERDAGTYRIAVRLAPDSRGGSRGMWNLQAGARIETTNPTSLLEIDWTGKNYCLIAAASASRRSRDRRRPAPQEHRRSPALRVKSRGDAAFLDELSSLLGDRLIVHASDEGARLDLDATFRALPTSHRRDVRADADAGRRAARLERLQAARPRRPALRNLRLQRPDADGGIPRCG
jgi:hypothetical protein